MYSLLLPAIEPETAAAFILDFRESKEQRRCFRGFTQNQYLLQELCCLAQ